MYWCDPRNTEGEFEDVLDDTLPNILVDNNIQYSKDGNTYLVEINKSFSYG